MVVGMCICQGSEASYTLQDGRLMKTEELATLSVQEHYSLAKDAFQQERWDDVIRQARIILLNFPGTIFAADVHYDLGVAYFHREELDLANEHLSKYLQKNKALKFFEETMAYKFAIAEQFAAGVKHRLLGKHNLPKWFSAYKAIYA